MSTRPLDTCAACRTPRRRRQDGRIARHYAPTPTDSGWTWPAPPRKHCPGSGRLPLSLTKRNGAPS